MLKLTNGLLGLGKVKCPTERRGFFFSFDSTSLTDIEHLVYQKVEFYNRL